MSARLPALLVACALAGCAGLLPGDEEGAQALGALIADVQRTVTLPAPERERALADARRDHADAPRVASALRVSLLLSLPGAPQDVEAAIEVLRPYVEPAPETDLGRYAALLQQQLNDRARQARRIERLRARLEAARASPLLAPLPPPPQDPQLRVVGDLVIYAQEVAKLSPEDQRGALAAAEREFESEPGDAARVRLALLLALPGTSMHDDARALRLLEPFAPEQATTPLQHFALLLKRQVDERARDRRRNAQLREQLEALRDIERSLIERRAKP